MAQKESERQRKWGRGAGERGGREGGRERERDVLIMAYILGVRSFRSLLIVQRN